MEKPELVDPADPEEKLNFKRILPIFTIVLVDLLGLTIIIPLLPLYATSFGASPAVIGFLGATYPMLQFIGAPILGRLSDRFGRKPVLVISQIGTLVGFLLLGFANTLPLLFLSRIIDGISGANIATAQAAISDSTSEKTRTQGLGLIGAAFGLGFTVGPVLAFIGLAISDNNYQVPAFLAAFFSLVSILLTIFWFKETLPEEQRGAQETDRPDFSFRSLARAVKHPAVGLLLILMLMQQLAFGGMEQLLPLFTLSRLGLNAAGNAIVFVYVGILTVIVQAVLIGRWSRAYGDRRLVFGGLIVFALGMLLLAVTPPRPVPWYSEAAMTTELTSEGGELTSQEINVDLPDEEQAGWLGLAWILVAIVPIAAGGGVLTPTINSLITKRVNYAEVGGMLGISAAFYSMANALGPILGGFLFEWFGAGAPFLAGSIILVILFVVAVRRLTPGREESAPAGLARGRGGH